MPDQWERPFYLRDVSVHPKRNLIIREDEDIQIEPKVMDVLCALAEEHGGVISRDELVSKVWGDPGVGDERLTRAISQLRKALHDSSRDPQFIETVPKRGYRVAAPVTYESSPRASSQEGLAPDVSSSQINDQLGPQAPPPLPANALTMSERHRWRWGVGAGVVFLMVIFLLVFLVRGG